MTTVFINSKYRQFGSFDKFTIQIVPPEKFTKVKLLDCSISQTQYVINSTCNTFNIINGASTTNVTIPVGNYSPVDLVNTINNLLTGLAGSVGFLVAFSSVSGKITFSSSSNLTYQFNTTNSAFYQLGFQSTIYSNITSLTGDYPVNLSPPTHLFLNINGLGLPNIKTATTQPCSGNWAIISNGSSYTYSNWASNSNYDLTFYTAVNNTSILDISLLNSDGSLAGINSDWSFQLLLV